MKTDTHLSQAGLIIAGMRKLSMPEDYLAIVDGAMVAGYHYGNALLHAYDISAETVHTNTPSSTSTGKPPRWFSMSCSFLITVGPLTGFAPFVNTGRSRVTLTSAIVPLLSSSTRSSRAATRTKRPAPPILYQGAAKSRYSMNPLAGIAFAMTARATVSVLPHHALLFVASIDSIGAIDDD